MKKIISLAILVICACADKQNEPEVVEPGEDAFMQRRNAPVETMSVEDMQDWLQVMIHEYETEYRPWRGARLYQFEWRKRTMYYMYDMFNSCQWCNVYFDNGEKIKWENTAAIADFEHSTINWKQIWFYEIGSE
jgi:hypothetical protein